MSAEHGHGGSEEVSFTSIFASIILAILGIGAITEPVEEVVKTFIQGDGGHGH
jgi:hypothetical protein